MSSTFHLGALVQLTQHGNEWKATQTELGHVLPPLKGVKGRKEIDWSYGPIVGYVDTDTFEVGLDVTVATIRVGHIAGNLRDGIVLQINLFLVTGEIKVYLKNGNEMWVHLSLKIRWDGSYDGDFKVITI